MSPHKPRRHATLALRFDTTRPASRGDAACADFVCAMTDEPVDAEPVELDYARVNVARSFGRHGQFVVVRGDPAVLPRLCLKTGVNDDEAEAAGTTLRAVRRRPGWSPAWSAWSGGVAVVVGLVLLGCVGLLIAFVVAAVIQVAARRRVTVDFFVRDDLYRRRRATRVVFLTLAVTSFVGGIAASAVGVGNAPGAWAALGSLGLALFGLLSSLGDLRVRIHRALPDGAAEINGAGRAFLERAPFDFEVARG